MPIVPVDPSTLDPADAARIAELRGGAAGGGAPTPPTGGGGGRIVPAPPGFTPPGAPSAPAATPPAQPAYVSDYPFEKRRADEPAPQESWKRWGVRRAIEGTGDVVGALAGEAAGLPVTLPLALSGNLPAAGVAAWGAGTVGKATGLTGADAINALIDKYAYGRTTDFTLVNAAKDEAQNLAGTLGGELVLSMIPEIFKSVSGRRSAEESLTKATETAGGISAEYAQRKGEIEATRAGAEKEAQETAITKAQPTAQREMIERATGRTPATASETRVPVSVPQGPALIPGETPTTFGAPPEHLAAKRGFQNTYNGIRERIYTGYEKEYDDLLGKYKPQPVKDPSEVINEIRNQELWQHQNAQIPYSADARRVIARGKALFDPKSLTEKNMVDLGRSGEVYVSEAQGALGKYEPPDPDEIELKPKGPATFGQLMAFRSYAKRMAAKATDDISAKALSEIEDATTRSYLKQGLSEEDVGKLGNLNDRYRDFKLLFDHVTGKAVSKAGDAVAAADEVFTNPKLTERMLQMAQTAAPQFDASGKQIGTLNEREQIKNAFGDWAQTNPRKVFTTDPVVAKDRATAFAKIDPSSPLGKPDALMFVAGKLDTLRNTPGAMAEYEAGFAETQKEIQLKAANQTIGTGIGLLKRMGPLGASTMRQVNLTRDPIEKARIVDEFFDKMDDREFNRLVAQKQRIFGRSMVEKMAEPEEEKAGGVVGGMWGRMKRNWPGYAMAAGLTGMMFTHASPFYTVMAVGGGAAAIRERYQNYVIRSLASKYADPVMSSMSRNAFRQVGKYSALALADVGGSKVSKATLPQIFPGLAEQPTGEAAPPGPTSRAGGFSLPGEGTAYAEELPAPKAGPAIREAQNREIAPSPGGADRAGEIDKGLVSGRAPTDVTRDLERGRLSTDEIGKLLRRSSSADPGAAVAGIPLTDLMSAAETGAPWEKQMLVPLLQQRMQQELPKLGNKTTQANLSRRFSALQRETGMGTPQAAQPMQ